MSAQNLIYSLTELREDPIVNKSIKNRISKIIDFIDDDQELGKDKALLEIEEMMAKDDVKPYLRTQIWNIISMIENL